MEVLGFVEFVDGVKCSVYILAGKQYVENDLGEPIFSEWLVDRRDWESTLPRRDEVDEPLTVHAVECRKEHAVWPTMSIRPRTRLCANAGNNSNLE
jgi:hypothetical protein